MATKFVTVDDSDYKLAAPVLDALKAEIGAGGGGPVTVESLPAGVVLWVDYDGGGESWPPRPTARTDIRVQWYGGANRPPGMIEGDVWFTAAAAEPPVAPSITSTSMGGATVGTAFSQTLAATGTTPITWSIASGALPAGLTLSTGGTISGTPSVAGSGSVTVRATNSAGQDDQVLSWTVTATAVAPTITTTALGTLTQGAAFTLTVGRTGTAPITWAVTEGALPVGLSLNVTTGVISGTPTAPGAYSFTLTATNGAGSDTQAFSGTVSAAPSGGPHSVFGATTPAVATVATDAAPTITTANGFYTSGASATGWRCVGARIYVPAGSVAVGKSATLGLWMAVGGGNPLPDLSTTPERSATIASLVAGWNEVAWAPREMTPGVPRTFIGANVGNDGTYISAREGVSFDAYPSATAPTSLFLTETDTGEQLRSVFRIGSGATQQAEFNFAKAQNWYGVDIIVDEGVV